MSSYIPIFKNHHTKSTAEVVFAVERRSMRDCAYLFCEIELCTALSYLTYLPKGGLIGVLCWVSQIVSTTVMGRGIELVMN